MKPLLTQLLYTGLILLAGFGCSKTHFGFQENTLVSKKGLFSIRDAILQTELNTPIDFTVSHSGNSAGMLLSLTDRKSVV